MPNNQQLNNQQIRLVHVAVRAAGLRSKQFEGRYRMLLAQYRQPTGRPVTSCKQLNNTQLDDLLAICKAHGWQMPGQSEDSYRKKVAGKGDSLSMAQAAAIKHLRGDLGWADRNLSGFIRRMTGGKKDSVCELSVRQAYSVIEGLKAILGRERGQTYNNLNEVKEEMEATDGAFQT